MELIVTASQLRRQIRRRGLNGRKLARLAGTSQPTISRLASGVQKKCRGDLGLRIEEALGVEPGTLFKHPARSTDANCPEASRKASGDELAAAVNTDSAKVERRKAA